MTLQGILVLFAAGLLTTVVWYAVHRRSGGPGQCMGCGQCDKTGVCVLSGKPVGKSGHHSRFYAANR